MMKMRRVALYLGLMVLAGCSGGGGGSEVTPSPGWSRERADNANSGLGGSLAENDGSLVRTFDAGEPIRTTPAIGPSGVVFVGTGGGRVLAVMADMTLKWQFAAQLGGIRSSIAVDSNERIYFGTEDGWVVCLNADGAEVWRVNVGAAVQTSPVYEYDVIDERTTALFVGTAGGRFFALGGTDGAVRWQYPGGPALGAITASPAFDGFTLSVVSADAVLHSVRRDGSALYAAFDIDAAAVAPAAAPSLSGSSLVITGLTESGAGVVTAVTTGEQSRTARWRTSVAAPVLGGAAQISRSIEKKTTDDEGATSKITVVVRELVVVDEAGAAYVLDEQIGAPGSRCIGGDDDAAPCRTDADCRSDDGTAKCEALSRCVGGSRAGTVCRSDETDDCPDGACVPLGTPALFSVNARVQASPTAGTDATILISAAPEAGGGVLYAVGIPSAIAITASTCPSDGSPPPGCRWTVPAAGPIEAAPAIGKDGTVYFGSTDGKLYAVSKGSS